MDLNSNIVFTITMYLWKVNKVKNSINFNPNDGTSYGVYAVKYFKSNVFGGKTYGGGKKTNLLQDAHSINQNKLKIN